MFSRKGIAGLLKSFGVSFAVSFIVSAAIKYAITKNDIPPRF